MTDKIILDCTSEAGRQLALAYFHSVQDTIVATLKECADIMQNEWWLTDVKRHALNQRLQLLQDLRRMPIMHRLTMADILGAEEYRGVSTEKRITHIQSTLGEIHLRTQHILADINGTRKEANLLDYMNVKYGYYKAHVDLWKQLEAAKNIPQYRMYKYAHRPAQ